MEQKTPLIIFAILTVLLVIEVIFDDPFNLADSLFFLYLLIFIFYAVYLAIVAFYIKKIEDQKTRLTAMKLSWLLLIGLTLTIAIFYVVENTEELVLILGIVWGAMAIALRDMVQNFFGSLVVVFMRIYRIGDRISVKGVYGEVMNIGLLRTTLMQLDRRGGDTPTGDILTIPNGALFREVIGNTSRHTSVTWDEIQVSLPAGVDFDNVREAILPIIEEHTHIYAEKAREEMEKLARKKFLVPMDIRPTFYLTLDSGGMLLSIRYITDIATRAAIKTEVTLGIAKALERLGLMYPPT